MEWKEPYKIFFFSKFVPLISGLNHLKFECQILSCLSDSCSSKHAFPFKTQPFHLEVSKNGIMQIKRFHLCMHISFILHSWKLNASLHLISLWPWLWQKFLLSFFLSLRTCLAWQVGDLLNELFLNNEQNSSPLYWQSQKEKQSLNSKYVCIGGEHESRRRWRRKSRRCFPMHNKYQPYLSNSHVWVRYGWKQTFSISLQLFKVGKAKVCDLNADC